VLRPFAHGDAPEVQRLCGDRAIAETTLTIPHPYPDGVAEQWIAGHEASFAAGRGVNFAVERREDAALAGAVGLVIDPDHRHAELGYWIARAYWGLGYATEAAAAVVRYGFEELGLNRIFAQHFTTNPASGRVMQKLGMQYEGRRRGHILKWGQFMDDEVYAILAEDLAARRPR
jgi:RimJ/RimL family protein N-acetyltransferase